MSQDIHEQEEYLKEYRRMLKGYAQLAAEHPERIDQLREAVEFTASVMISNCPGVVTEFRKLSQEIDRNARQTSPFRAGKDSADAEGVLYGG